MTTLVISRIRLPAESRTAAGRVAQAGRYQMVALSNKLDRLATKLLKREQKPGL